MAGTERADVAFRVALLELRAGSHEPSPRGGATLTQVDSGDVYLIGGASREAVCFGDVQRFDLERREWSRVEVAARSPEFAARSGHSAVALGRCIFVFGGLNLVEGAIFNDVFVFDTHTCAWSRVDVADGEVPMPRNAHAAVMLPARAGASYTRMLVFGGSSPDDGAFDDAFVLHIPVDYDAAREDQEPLQWERVAFAGDEKPEARELHCATLLPTASLVCFSGGRNRDGGMCTDMALLDTRSWEWQLVPICEWNRCSHVAGLVGGDGALVSFGGFDGSALRDDIWIYRDDVESWERAAINIVADRDRSISSSSSSSSSRERKQENPGALERFGHAGCTVELLRSATAGDDMTEKEKRTALLVFGGMNASRDLNDLLLIETQQQQQQRAEARG